MKKQLLLLSLLMFSLGAMDAPCVKKIERKNKVSSLLQLCLAITKDKFNIPNMKKDFLAGKKINNFNLPRDLEQLIISKQVETPLSRLFMHVVNSSDNWLEQKVIPYEEYNVDDYKKPESGDDILKFFNSNHIRLFYMHHFYIKQDRENSAGLMFHDSNIPDQLLQAPSKTIITDMALSPDRSKVAIAYAPQRGVMAGSGLMVYKIGLDKAPIAHDAFVEAGAKPVINWHKDGTKIKIKLRENSDLIKIFNCNENAQITFLDTDLQNLIGSEKNDCFFIERALFLILAYDKKFGGGLDIAENEKAKEVFKTFDPEIQRILIDKFQVKGVQVDQHNKPAVD